MIRRSTLALAALLLCSGAYAQTDRPYTRRQSTEQKSGPVSIDGQIVTYTEAKDPALIFATGCTTISVPSWRGFCEESFIAFGGTLTTVTPAAGDLLWLFDASDSGHMKSVLASSLGGTISPGTVTLAMMADVATDTIFCRDTAGTGVPELCTLGASLAFTSANVIGRAALTGDVTASANSNSTTIANNAVTSAKIADGTVALADMADLAASRIIGRGASGGTGVPEVITMGTGLQFSGSTLQSGPLTGDVTKSAGDNATTIADNAVTFAKMQNLSNDTIIGRFSSGTGDPEELTLGGNLAITTDLHVKDTYIHDLTQKTTMTVTDRIAIADEAASGVAKYVVPTAVPNAWQSVKLTGTQTFNSSTLANITGLAISMTSGHYYNVQCRILASSATSTTGLKIGATWGSMTAGAALSRLAVSNTSVLQGAHYTSGEGRAGTDTSGDNIIGLSEFSGAFNPSADGTFQLQAGTETGSVVQTVYAGSNCIWQDLP